MSKNPKRKLLFTMLFLTILMVSSTYAAMIPNAHAAEMTPQQKGLTILNDVVGIDMTKYDLTVKDYSEASQASYLGVVPQQSVIYNLTSSNSKLSLLCTFANGNLQMIQVLEKEGAPSLTKPTIRSNALAAEGFLSKYQTYTDDRLYGNLKATLNEVDASKNFTKTSGNMQLEVTAFEDGSTIFKWYYTANGAKAPYSKFIALGFENGFLTAFVNNWQFYKIGSTSVKLTKEEGMTIALEAARSHLSSLLDADSLEPKNFNESNIRWTTLIFDGSLSADKARDADPLKLYPVWRVGIGLNKWYGSMYGLEVDVWADTGEVKYIQEAWSTLLPSEESAGVNMNKQTMVSEAIPNLSLLITLVAIFTTLTIGTAIVWISRDKVMKSANSLRPFLKRTGAKLLCCIVASLILLAPIATASASRAAEMWGSESAGATNYPIPQGGPSWRKHSTEVYWQRLTTANITNFFAANGYVGYDYQGASSSKSNILNNIDWLCDYYDHVAVVDFDHGVGGYPSYAPQNEFHYMFEDYTGTLIGPYGGETYTDFDNHGVFDMDIFPLTDSSIIFAFINTCLSANIAYGQGTLPPSPPYSSRALGLPFAWTHRTVADKSTSGFTIVNNISDDGYGDPDWGLQAYIGFTYGAASLMQRIPLVIGSYYHDWVYSFFYNALYYDVSVNAALDSASWQYMCQPFGTSPLANGFTAYWWDPDNPEAGYQDNCKMAVYGNGNIHLKQYTPPPDMPNVPTVVSGPTEGNPSTYYQFSAFAGDPYAHAVQYRFDWGDGTPYTTTYPRPDGYTGTASHSWSSGGFYSVRVQARCAYSDWGSWSSPYYVNIGGQTAQLTVYAYNQYGYPGYVPLYINGSYVGTTGYAYTVLLGNRQIYVESPLYDGYWHVFDHYEYNGYSYGANPLTILFTEANTLTAYYHSYY